MSCRNVQIALLQVPGDLPSWAYHSSGNVYFDLDPEEKFAKKKEAGALSIANQIKGAGVQGFSLMGTAKNELLINGIALPGSYELDHYKVIPVRAMDGGQVIRQNAMKVLTKDGAQERYEVELIDGSTFWKDQLESKPIQDVDFGNFTLSLANLQSNWANNAAYQDGDPGVYFPLVHHGNWKTPATYTETAGGDLELDTGTTAEVGDFRPWFHLLSVLQKLFCSIGWTFRSPILEDDWGRRLIVYILTDLGGGEGLQGFKYNAVVLEDYVAGIVDSSTYPGNPPGLYNTKELQATNDHTLPGFDNGGAPGYYDTDPAPFHPQRHYFGTRFRGTTTTTLEATLDATIYGDRFAVAIILLVYDPNDSNPLTSTKHLTSSADFVFDDEVKTISWTTPVYNTEATWRTSMSINLRWADPGQGSGLGIFTIKAGSRTYNTPITAELEENVTLNLSSFIKRTYTGMEIFKGALHLLGGGRIYPDHVNRIMWAFHPDEVEIWGGRVPEAFYKAAPLAEQLPVLCKSEKVTVREVSTNRYHKIMFADPDDKLVKERGYNSNTGLHMREIDLGPDRGYKEKTTKDKNPFFEATEMYTADDIKDTSDNGPDIPAIWDNLEFEESTDTKPRVLFAAGYYEEITTEGPTGTTTSKTWLLQGVQQTSYPAAFHVSDRVYKNGGATRTFEENVIYGTRDKDLYLFRRQAFMEALKALGLEYLVLIDNSQYNAINFRTRYIIFYNGRQQLCKLEAINDFRPTERLSTPMTFRPKLQEQIC